MSDDREKQTTGNVRSLCPCETNAENPGPHIPTCPWSDPDYVPGAEAMRAAAADALGVDPHEVRVVEVAGEAFARNTWDQPWGGALPASLVEDQAMAEVAPSRIVANLEERIGMPVGARIERGPSCIPDAFAHLATETDPARLRKIGRLVGFERGTLEESIRAIDAGEPVIFGIDTPPLIAQRAPAERCPWVKIAGTAEQVRCLREPHDTEEDCTNHDWSGPLEPRQPLIRSRGVGAWDPREQPGAQVTISLDEAIALLRLQDRKRVILESPYAGDAAQVARNVRYARRALRDSALRGEAPIASHLLFTQPGVLRDGDPLERALGIACGLAWVPVSEGSVVYTDHGITPGMAEGVARAEAQGRSVEYRKIGAEPEEA